MKSLPTDLRRQLESVVIEARDVAEAAARSALQKRAVDAAEPFPHFAAADKEQRNRLRARGRQVGDVRHANKTQGIDQLAQELGYEYWHRMLFARFLAENALLMHPDGVAVSLEECEELAPDADPPAPNGFALAARYASRMLPQIFRTDDVLLEIEFAPEQRLALEKLLNGLPKRTFEADDSLGWVYQFWQTKRKDEVNAGGDKIDGRTLPAVTQLFTEPYMVQFLLHNTIGAWWVGRQINHESHELHELEEKTKPLAEGLKKTFGLDFLRLDSCYSCDSWFRSWPRSFAGFTLLDPCCGSGHFLVSAFNLLVPLRMHDESLSARDACEAVLRENLHGLELDPRCTQIAAFALALAAWKYPDAGGYRELPPLNIACSGQGVAGKKDDWLKLANGDLTLRNGMERLYELFEKAPHLGSLIDPRRQDGDLFHARHAELDALLKKALAKHAQDADLSSVGVAAEGITSAADLLARQYTLVVTNVPYLGRGKQGEVLKEYIETHYAIAKADLATAFVMRCLQLCAAGGSTALVTPQNWLFLTSYKKLREELLKRRQWNLVARLGPNAFQDMNFWAATTALEIISSTAADGTWLMSGIDVSDVKEQSAKADRLADRVPTPVRVVPQAGQLKNPDAVISTELLASGSLLSQYAISIEGLSTGDGDRYVCFFWEVEDRSIWSRFQSTPDEAMDFGGNQTLIRWENGKGTLAVSDEARIQGSEAWGCQGILIGQMNQLPCCLHTGAIHGKITAVIKPYDVTHLPAIWSYLTSSAYRVAVRKVNQKVSVSTKTLAQVPFDLAHWQAVAAEKYPNGLPEPHSDDPTQWLFRGDIATSTDPLQVAVARLLGYRWPDQPTADVVVDPFVDDDGIVCLPGVRHEAPAAERLADLLRAVGYKTEVDLAAWLRDKFFEEHCKRFHHRPFVWHIWDGRKDGFAALLNYHKLTHKTLENLTYSYLGDWITAQSKSDKVGADLRLAAAQALQEKLKLILAGEPPYDIFVRWKPLHEQAVGWQPDLNDGVRMNIRPFVKADILRKTPNIKWTKDRGKEPARDAAAYPWFNAAGDRVNDKHYTTAEKQKARTTNHTKDTNPEKT